MMKLLLECAGATGGLLCTTGAYLLAQVQLDSNSVIPLSILATGISVTAVVVWYFKDILNQISAHRKGLNRVGKRVFGDLWEDV